MRSSPIVRLRRVTSARAAGEGLYRSCVIASCTRALVVGRTFGRSLSTRDTVWCETPASLATSKMFAARFPGSSCLPAALGLRLRHRAGSPPRRATRSTCHPPPRSATTSPSRSTTMRDDTLQDLLELGRDEHDGHAVGRQLPDEILDFDLSADVDAARRLVEQDRARGQREQPGQQHLLLVASGEGAGDGFGDRRAHAERLDPARSELDLPRAAGSGGRSRVAPAARARCSPARSGPR